MISMVTMVHVAAHHHLGAVWTLVNSWTSLTNLRWRSLLSSCRVILKPLPSQTYVEDRSLMLIIFILRQCATGTARCSEQLEHLPSMMMSSKADDERRQLSSRHSCEKILLTNTVSMVARAYIVLPSGIWLAVWKINSNISIDWFIPCPLMNHWCWLVHDIIPSNNQRACQWRFFFAKKTYFDSLKDICLPLISSTDLHHW